MQLKVAKYVLPILIALNKLSCTTRFRYRTNKGEYKFDPFDYFYFGFLNSRLKNYK